MAKKYYADVYFYVCPACKKQVTGKMYFGVFERAEIGAAKMSGVISYRCTNLGCKAIYPWGRVLPNGEVVEVSATEALSSGLVYDSPGKEKLE